MYVVNGYAYDNLLDRHTDKILRSCPRVIEYLHRAVKGAMRADLPTSSTWYLKMVSIRSPSYPILLPSRNRTSLRWHNYVSQSNDTLVPLPVYTQHFSEALQEGEIRKALCILHALGQFITLWPREGLWNMIGLIQIDHPMIHRGVVRVLAEVYNRYPVETLRFFANSGIVMSPGDLRDIRARIDPRTGRRQFEVLQWGRVLHFLLSFPDARPQFFKALRAIYSASSMRDAIHGVADAFGWTKKIPIHIEAV